MKRKILSRDAGKPYLVGANYWASHAAHRMWERWDSGAVEKDLAFAESLGLNALRAFFWSPELNPLPGEVNRKVLDRFEEFLKMCARRSIGVFPTFFVGHMSGTDWDIPWRQGRDFCADPYMVYWETDLVRKVVSRFKGNPTILGWILTNELPNYTGSLGPETAAMWTRAMHQAVKEADPEALVSTGDGARCEVRTNYDGFRVEWVKDHVDWIGVHLYNYFNYEAGDCDELRKSYHIPCRLRYVDMGKPVLLEEFGLSDLVSGREEAAGYYRSVLYSGLVNGNCGALAWCLTDFDLPDETPYRFQPHELFYGLADVNHERKPQADVLADFSRFVRERHIENYQMAPSAEAILVPYAMFEDFPHHEIDRLRSYRLLEQTFTLAKMAGLNPDFVRNIENLDEYRLAMLSGGARLKVPEWHALEQWVRRGGTLYYSYTGFKGGVYAPNFESLFGCRQRIRFGQLEQPEQETVSLKAVKDFGGVAGGQTFTVPRGRLGRESARLPIELEGAQTLVEDAQGRPALIANRLGQGRTFFSAYPLEYMLLNTPDGNMDSELHRLYRSLALEAGIRPRFEGKHPFIEAEILEAEGKALLLIVVNHSHRRIENRLKDLVSGETLQLELEAKGIRRFELAGGAWKPA